MKRIGMLCLLLAGIHTSAGAAPAPAATGQAAAPAPLFNLAVQVEISGDGAVTAVVPAADVPEALRAALVARVSQWHFEPVSWQGQPASLRRALIVRGRLATTTDGKQVLQLVDTRGWVAIEAFLGTQGPRYPESAMKRGVAGEFVYTMRQAADGSLSDVQPLWSGGEASQGKWAAQFDASLREAYGKARRAPVLINGQPVACRLQLSMDFARADKPPVKSAEDTKARDDAIAAWRAATPDVCPEPKLLTDVAGMVL